MNAQLAAVRLVNVSAQWGFPYYEVRDRVSGVLLGNVSRDGVRFWMANSTHRGLGYWTSRRQAIRAVLFAMERG
jgi:hypothetical protein